MCHKGAIIHFFEKLFHKKWYFGFRLMSSHLHQLACVLFANKNMVFPPASPTYSSENLACSFLLHIITADKDPTMCVLFVAHP